MQRPELRNRAGIGMNHLSGLRRGKTQLAGHHVDASGLGKLGLGQAQLAVLFAQLVERLLFLLDAVAASRWRRSAAGRRP